MIREMMSLPRSPCPVPRPFHPFRCASGCSNTVTGGSEPRKRSTSATPVWPQLPCPSFDVATPVVSTFTSPQAHSVPSWRGFTGSYQPPSLMRMAPGMISSVIFSPARICPRWLNTRTTSPSFRPRAAASFGFIQQGSRPATS